MSPDTSPHDLIMQAVLRKSDCIMEDLVPECPTLTWNQIFLEVDRLSRSGKVRLAMEGPGRYVVTPAEPDKKTVAA